MRFAIVAAALASALVAPAARAETAPVESGDYVRDQVAARVNPMGLFDEARVGHRQPLYASSSPALRHNFVGAALNASFSPAFARAGVFVEYAPTSFVDVFGIYEAGAWFGPWGLRSYPNAGVARWSDDDLSREPSYSAPMQQLVSGLLLHFQIGRRVFVKSNGRFVFEQVGLHGGDRAFYDPNWDILFPNEGFIYVDDVDVQVEPARHLRVGARWNVTHAFFAEADHARSDTTQRAGPIASYVFYERPHAAFNTPMLSLVVNWWVEHPYRAGEAAPYVGVAFSFQSNPR